MQPRIPRSSLRDGVPVRAERGADLTADPSAVVEEYFARVRAGDPRVAELFHDQAEIRGLGMRRSGRQEIERFYARTLDQGRPAPRLVGPMLIEGGRVMAELSITIADGPSVHVLDLFEVENGRILSLTYFLADYPSE